MNKEQVSGTQVEAGSFIESLEFNLERQRLADLERRKKPVISLRLDRELFSQLLDFADEKGVRPSAFARELFICAFEEFSRRRIGQAQ